MPSRRWYLVALLVAVSGLGGAALYCFPRFTAVDEGVIRVIAPGETVLALHPGTHTVFHEYSSALDGRHDEAHHISGLRIAVVNPAGVPIVAGTIAIRHR